MLFLSWTCLLSLKLCNHVLSWTGLKIDFRGLKELPEIGNVQQIKKTTLLSVRATVTLQEEKHFHSVACVAQQDFWQCCRSGGVPLLHGLQTGPGLWFCSLGWCTWDCWTGWVSPNRAESRCSWSPPTANTHASPLLNSGLFTRALVGCFSSQS